jgi:hypothetical protein
LGLGCRTIVGGGQRSKTGSDHFGVHETIDFRARPIQNPDLPLPKKTGSDLFLLGGLLFPDPLTDRSHLLVIEIHETDADAF